MHRSLSRWILFACLCASAVARAESEPATNEPTEEEAAAGLREHHRHHHHGGVAMFVAMSLDTLGIEDARRPQLEKLRGDLHSCMAPGRAAEKTLLSTIADGVAAGTVDTAKVDTSVAQMGTTAGNVHTCAVVVLEQLHSLLTPAERAVVVEKVQANYRVWRHVNHEADPAGQEKHGRLAELAAELNLSPDQVTKMSAALKVQFSGPRAGAFDPQRVEAHVKGFSDAFAADTFTPKNISVDANSQMAMHGASRMALFYETITPLLTPDQRSQLAEQLRAHAAYVPASGNP